VLVTVTGTVTSVVSVAVVMTVLTLCAMLVIVSAEAATIAVSTKRRLTMLGAIFNEIPGWTFPLFSRGLE